MVALESAFSSSSALRRPLVLALGIITFAGSGSLIVRAADDRGVRDTLIQFNRPIRQRFETYLPRETLRLPPRARDERSTLRPVAAVAQPPRPFVSPLRRALETSAKEPDATVGRPREKSGSLQPPRRKKGDARRTLARGSGNPVATNYCVRLSDGFAFPLGHSGVGEMAQNRACRAACPGAETAIFTLPAGASDLDQLRLGAITYASLPSAFRYRETMARPDACKPVGATQSSAALLADLTLRRGDIVMTRIGMRHFDGSARYPYRAAAFSDALPKLPRREIAIVRAMEVASVRGLIPDNAGPGLRARVVEGIRIEGARANREEIAEISGVPAGFAELRARERKGKTTLPVVRRPAGLVALN
jgi:hypothetical protein